MRLRSRAAARSQGEVGGASGLRLSPPPWLSLSRQQSGSGPPMPECIQPGFREFPASANQALADLRQATGIPVRIVAGSSLAAGSDAAGKALMGHDGQEPQRHGLVIEEINRGHAGKRTPAGATAERSQSRWRAACSACAGASLRDRHHDHRSWSYWPGATRGRGCGGDPIRPMGRDGLCGGMERIQGNNQTKSS